jgi:hypothetical protein
MLKAKAKVLRIASKRRDFPTKTKNTDKLKNYDFHAVWVAAASALFAAISAGISAYQVWHLNEALEAPFQSNLQDRQIAACNDFRYKFLELFKELEFQMSLDAMSDEPRVVGVVPGPDGEIWKVIEEDQLDEKNVVGTTEFSHSLDQAARSIVPMHFFSGLQTREQLLILEDGINFEAQRNLLGRRMPLEEFLSIVSTEVDGVRTPAKIAPLTDTHDVFESISQKCGEVAVGDHKGLL